MISPPQMEVGNTGKIDIQSGPHQHQHNKEKMHMEPECATLVHVFLSTLIP